LNSSRLRWALFAGAVLGAARCFLTRATPGRLAFTAVCAGFWFVLSRRKVYSLDADVVGLRRRR
jgi:hypothetical protein